MERVRGPAAMVLQVVTERPQGLALGGGQLGNRHAGPDAQHGLGVGMLDLGVVCLTGPSRMNGGVCW